MNDILDAKDQRQKEIQNLLKKSKSVILIKSNVPGQNKSIDDAYFLIRIFLSEIIKKFNVKHIDFYESMDGPYYLVSLDEVNPNQDKIILMELEDSHPLGRMIDLDLYTILDKHSVKRSSFGKPLRKCYICHLDAAICIKNQTHKTEDLIHHMKENIENFLKDTVSKNIKYAIFRELELPIKFGLVTKDHPGSHQNMDYHLMSKAAHVILPYFEKLFMLGYHASDLSNLLEQSRPIGLQAESDMLNQTDGINCYKGLIYVLGLVTLAFGYTIKHHEPLIYLFDHIKEMTKNVLHEFKKTPTSVGMKQYRTYGFKGVRGEAYLGFPTIQSALLDFKDTDLNLRLTLKNIILETEDSCFLNRAITMERYQHFKEILKMTDISNLDKARSLTDDFIKENLSFGGSADLLISVIFIHQMRQIFL